MRIHLVRHGETRHNVEGRIQGDLLDDGLNATGRAQADALHRRFALERLRGLVVSAVYTSPLLRARETAARIAAALDAPEPRRLVGLRELSWGRHNGRENVGAVREDMERVLTAWARGDLSAAPSGGERPGEAWARAMADVAPLLERHAGEDVVIVAHGRINKVLMSGLVHGHLHHMERYPQTNAGVSVLEGPVPWRVLASDATEHLAGLRAVEERAS